MKVRQDLRPRPPCRRYESQILPARKRADRLSGSTRILNWLSKNSSHARWGRELSTKLSVNCVADYQGPLAGHFLDGLQRKGSKNLLVGKSGASSSTLVSYCRDHRPRMIIDKLVHGRNIRGPRSFSLQRPFPLSESQLPRRFLENDRPARPGGNSTSALGRSPKRSGFPSVW